MRTPRFWHRRTLCSALLTPAAWVYGLAAAADRAITRAQHAPLPAISIGNATVGGTGKTPTAMALVPLLAALGFTPHILTRGYGGTQRAPHRITEHDDWQQVGDEALLLARTAPTWVSRNRYAAAHAAQQSGATIALCDDAHQHHRLAKTLSLLVVDGAYGNGNGKLLPAGPLREPFAAALARADAVILMGDDTHHITDGLSIPVFRATLAPVGDVSFLSQTPWLAFAGIGRPEKFYATLRAHGATLAETQDFADHHPYRAEEIDALLKRAIAVHARLITTEKDWVKLPTAAKPHIHPLPVSCQFADAVAVTDFLRRHLAP